MTQDKMTCTYQLPMLPLPFDLETKAVLRQLSLSHRRLAELKGVARTIPNEQILINTLTLQEAKDSSEVENIVTTNDELYRADLAMRDVVINASTKEVLNYRQSLQSGFFSARKKGLLTLNDIQQIQAELVKNSAGFRAVPGTTLRNDADEIVYIPPQDNGEIQRLMDNLEQYINDHAARRRPTDQNGRHSSPICKHPPLLRRQRSYRSRHLCALSRDQRPAGSPHPLPQSLHHP